MIERMGHRKMIPRFPQQYDPVRWPVYVAAFVVPLAGLGVTLWIMARGPERTLLSSELLQPLSRYIVPFFTLDLIGNRFHDFMLQFVVLDHVVLYLCFLFVVVTLNDPRPISMRLALASPSAYIAKKVLAVLFMLLLYNLGVYLCASENHYFRENINSSWSARRHEGRAPLALLACAVVIGAVAGTIVIALRNILVGRRLKSGESKS
jgi:uncharacterized membrane protein